MSQTLAISTCLPYTEPSGRITLCLLTLSQFRSHHQNSNSLSHPAAQILKWTGTWLNNFEFNKKKGWRISRRKRTRFSFQCLATHDETWNLKFLWSIPLLSCKVSWRKRGSWNFGQKRILYHKISKLFYLIAGLTSGLAERGTKPVQKFVKVYSNEQSLKLPLTRNEWCAMNFYELKV